ncbi:hypothetical protein V6N13_108713 [Hibiscus sabdariffa]|uniref:Uncharacterized protein n=1 Tax=Hibiscus sabdariffa TaxID=183260 RepID=A0ABR2SSW9_9ROSI
MLLFPPCISDGSICVDSDHPPENLAPPTDLGSVFATDTPRNGLVVTMVEGFVIEQFPSLERLASPLSETGLQLANRGKADHVIFDVVGDGGMEIGD